MNEEKLFSNEVCHIFDEPKFSLILNKPTPGEEISEEKNLWSIQFFKSPSIQM